MVSLRELANLANNARGEEAKRIYKLLRRLLIIVKSNFQVDRFIGNLEGKQSDEYPVLSNPPKIIPSPESPKSVVDNPPNKVIDIEIAKNVEVPKQPPEVKQTPPKPPAKRIPNKTTQNAVAESISRLLQLPQVKNADVRPLLPEPFELVISDATLTPSTFLAAQFRQVKAREEVLGILNSFVVLGWGSCAECQKDLCTECTNGGIRVKMNFDTVIGKSFTGTVWKGQIALLLRCSVYRLIEVWVERPEEINARLSEYLGRPFYVAGIVKDFQGMTYSVNVLTCLHWGAVTLSLNQLATCHGGDVA